MLALGFAFHSLTAKFLSTVHNRNLRALIACSACSHKKMNRVFLVLFLILVVDLQAGAGPAGPEWRQETGFRWAELNVPTGGKTGFRLLRPEDTGIAFTNTLDLRTGEANPVLFNGSGGPLGHFANCGLPDIYF